MAEWAQQERRAIRAAAETIAREMEQRPYPVLAMAALAGYVAGGGLFSAWSRPLARAALGAFLVPGVRERLREAVGEVGTAAAG